MPALTDAGRLWRYRLHLAAYLIRVSVVPQLLDVVHQAIQLPLPIHLLAPAQREADEHTPVRTGDGTGIRPGSFAPVIPR